MSKWPQPGSTLFKWHWDEYNCTEKGIVAGWPVKKDGAVGDPGTDKKQHHRDTHSC